MTRDEAKALLVQVVTDKQGQKATELMANVIELAARKDPGVRCDFPDLIEELVKEGELVEVEYVLPTMNYRCKSFLLPKDSEVRVVRNENC